MPEDTKSPDTESPAPESIPAIESSPAFQERTREALGGAPTKPPTFGQIGGPREVGPVRRELPGQAAKKSRPHNPAFDGPGEDLLAARVQVVTLQKLLSNLRASLEANLDQAEGALQTVEDSPLAKAEAELQGIDMDLVQTFLSFLGDARAFDEA